MPEQDTFQCQSEAEKINRCMGLWTSQIKHRHLDCGLVKGVHVSHEAVYVFHGHLIELRVWYCFIERRTY